VNDVVTVTRGARLAGRLVAALVMVLLVLASLAVPAASAAQAPTGLSATAVSRTTATLTWDAVPGASRYRVQYATRASMDHSAYQRVRGTRSRLTGLKPGTTYYVRVRATATDGAKARPYSQVATVRTARRPVKLLASAPLAVGSYNVKCANCLENLPNARPWSERRSAVVATIRNENLDVIGVQEASQGWLTDADGQQIDLSQFEDLQQRLGEPWRLTNDKRNNCVDDTTPTDCVYRDQGASQGTRILYNADRVEMLSSGSQLLPSEDAPNARYLAWAVLRQRNTGLQFFFANSHLQYGPDAYALRKKEAEVAVRTIQARNRDNLPVIAVGDFNSSRYARPSNAPYDVYMRAGFVDPIGGGKAGSSRPVDPTAARRTSTWLNSFNGFARQAKGNRSGGNGSYIDYMLTTPMRVSEWETVARLRGSRLAGVIPSDHNLLRMKVYLPR
jgi:endonuclease/exonuclease/phosphatase family metal-dependent hydrolase